MSVDAGWEQSLQQSLGHNTVALALLTVLSLVTVSAWIIYQSSTRTASEASDRQLVENWTVDLNQATLQELQLIPGLGPKLASSILQKRNQLGGFQSLDQLSEVPGIKEQRLRMLARYLKLSSSANRSPTKALSE